MIGHEGAVVTKAATVVHLLGSCIPLHVGDVMLPWCDPMKRRGRCSSQCWLLDLGSVPTLSCPHRCCWKGYVRVVDVPGNKFLGGGSREGGHHLVG